MIELPTVDQAEDAAANALARLIWDGTRSRSRSPICAEWADAGDPGRSNLVATCRELLRGPVVEVAIPGVGHIAGNYWLKSPTDPTLWALARFGARVVEITYELQDRPAGALGEVADLWARLLEEAQRVARS